MKRRRNKIDDEKRAEQDAALAQVLAEMEEEHGTPKHVLADNRGADAILGSAPLRAAARRDASRSSGGSSRTLVSYADLDSPSLLCSSVDSGRHSGRRDGGAPPGFVLDPSSGFYLNADSGYYYDNTQERELYGHAQSGIWYYFDKLAKAFRPYPADRLTAAQRRAVGLGNTDPSSNVPPSNVAPSNVLPPSAPPAWTLRGTPALASAVQSSSADTAPEETEEPPPLRAAAPMALPALDRRTTVSFRGVGGRVSGRSGRAGRTGSRSSVGGGSTGAGSTGAGSAGAGSAGAGSAGGGSTRAAVEAAAIMATNEATRAQESSDAVSAAQGSAAATQSAANQAAATTMEAAHVDRVALICKLCKRKFPTAETLQRHVSFSRLHAENLAALPLPY